MDNFDMIIEAAEELNETKEKGHCKRVFEKYAQLIDVTDINQLVMLFSICINKSLFIEIELCTEKKDEVYPQIMNSIVKDLEEMFISAVETETISRFSVERNELVDYLKAILNSLLSGVKYINPGKEWRDYYGTNELNTRFRREERVRDNMHSLINKKGPYKNFTEENKIEIPYMYSFVWDIYNFGKSKNLYEERNEKIGEGETSYLKLLPSNLKGYLMFLSKSTLEIIFKGILIDKNKYEQCEPNAPIKIRKCVYFQELLPTFQEVDEMKENAFCDLVDVRSRVRMVKNHEVPLIKKEVLKSVPLLPMFIDKRRMNKEKLRLIANILQEDCKLEKANRELKALQEERYRIIRDFSHTYENMQAIGLKEIANILIENEDPQIKQCGRVILAEYGMKDSLKAEVNLLRLNFEDKHNDIVDLIRKGIKFDKSDAVININSIFEEALKICLLRVIYSGNPRGEDQTARGMYKRIKSVVGSMKEFVQNFENEVIVNGLNIKNFLKNAGICLKFYADDEWNKLYFEKNKHAEVLLRSIFAELITNSFKYADLDDIIYFSLKLIENDYRIVQSNNYTDIIGTDSGIGLESKGEILKKINGHESYIIDKVFDERNRGKFTICFLIDRKLLDISERNKNE